MLVSVAKIINLLSSSITNGSVIAMSAVGLTLSYGVTRFINFAYGEFFTYGLFFTVFLTSASVGVALPIWAAGLISVVVVGVLAVVVARFFFDPISERGPIPLLLTSIGVAFLMRYVMIAGIGFPTESLPLPLMSSINVLGYPTVTPVALAVVVVAAVGLTSVHVILQYTLLGKKMRAVSSNRDLAEVVGINTDAVVEKTWFISGAAAALGGILYGVLFAPFRPTVGFTFLVVVFAATILGGIGRPYGAILGAYVVGFMTTFGTFFLSANYSRAYAFIILVVVLLFKPEGIAGGEI